MPFEERKRITKSRLTNCPFQIKGKRQNDGVWKIEIINNLHNHEASIDVNGHLVSRRLSKEELKPTIRGKVHFYDSEDVNKQYRKNINKEIVHAYNEALKYTTNRIKDYCISRNATYMLVQSDKSISEIFLKDLPEMGVLK